MLKTILFIFTFALIGCSESRVNIPYSEGGDLTAAIYLSAGDLDPKFNTLNIPTFFNLGKIVQEEGINAKTILLSKREATGNRIDIIPIALFSFEQDTIQFSYIISVPKADMNSQIGRNYNDFLLKNYKTQSNIENWFSSQCPDNTCKNFRWDNTYKALLQLQSNNK